MFDKLSLETTHMELMDCIWRLLFNINHSSGVTPLIREQRDKLAAYYTLKVPSLFRYRSLEKIDRELDALKNHKMWFSVKNALNDVFEIRVKEFDIKDFTLLNRCDYMLKQYNDKLEQYFQLKEIEKEEIERLKAEMIEPYSQIMEIEKAKTEQRIQQFGYQKMIDKFWKSSAIACLSEKSDNISMWSHYANNNRGMCIEYCTQELAQKTHFIMAPVNYSTELPSTKINDLQSELFLMSAIFTKYSDWEKEQEWRCIIARDADEAYDGRAPFGKHNGVALETSPAKAIYLGCNIDKNYLERIISLCKDTLKVPVYKMERSQFEYSLTPKILYSPT